MMMNSNCNIFHLRHVVRGRLSFYSQKKLEETQITVVLSDRSRTKSRQDAQKTGKMSVGVLVKSVARSEYSDEDQTFKTCLPGLIVKR